MFAEFKHTLRRMRGQMIGWGIGVALYGLMMVSLFSSIVSIEGFEELIASYPQEIMAFFGDMMAITTPEGYIDIYYCAYMQIIVGIFAVGAGASLLVGDEEKGILDLVLAHPVSRTALFWGRWLGFVAATAAILLVSRLSWVIPSGGSGMELTWIEFLKPFLPLFAVLLLFGTLALLLSMLLPSVRSAGMAAGGLLVANYLLIGLANINQDLESVIKFTPLHYYQGGKAVSELNWGWLACWRWRWYSPCWPGTASSGATSVWAERVAGACLRCRRLSAAEPRLGAGHRTTLVGGPAG
ncbi:MAG: ABC transporter permease subunit [Chloroflexi bacterium]|nr:ABC transporter permease subunit [Chloroflexota bacterium]